MTHRATTATLAAVGGLLGHHGGDYLVQRDRWCAPTDPDGRPLKQQPTRAGRRALAAHATSYAATQATTRAALYRAAGVRVPIRAQLAATLVECILHAVIDDGRLLRWCSTRTGTLRFHDHVPGGRAHLDQAAHLQVQILAGTLTTAAVVRAGA